MTRREPDPDAFDLEAEGMPEVDEQPEGIDDPVEGMVPPRDHPVGSLDPATTERGQLVGESLRERVAQEEPDRLPGDDGIVGRLVQPDQGMPDLDAEPTEMADEVVGDEQALSAEEAAVHLTDSP
ncbi:MAG: DUF5709 domain-containing protein [Acidimicrobiales bacterium]